MDFFHLQYRQPADANYTLTLGNRSMAYDLNGNLTTLTDPSGTTTYTWNARNQLVGLSGPGLTASFQSV